VTQWNLKEMLPAAAMTRFLPPWSKPLQVEVLEKTKKVGDTTVH
jgi:hypothetical protein